MSRFKKIDLFILLLILVASGTGALILGKDTSWDLRNYHFYNGYSFVTGRFDSDVAPAQLQTYLNPLPDLFTYLGIRYLPAPVFGFILAVAQGTGVCLVYCLGRVLTRRTPELVSLSLSGMAAATAFFGSGWFSEIGTPLGDNVVAIFVLGALLVLLSLPPDPSESMISRSVFFAGILVGFGTGLKLIGGIYFVGFLFSLFLLFDKGYVLKRYGAFCFGFSFGIMISSGFWMAKLWTRLESPLFPYFNKIFRSSYFDFINVSDERFFPRTLAHKIFYPLFFLKYPRLVCELDFFDLRLPLLYIVVLSLLVYACVRRGLETRNIGEMQACRTTYFLAVFSIASYAVWQSMFSYYRYLIPLEMLTPVVFVAIAASIRAAARFRWCGVQLLLMLMIVTSFKKPLDWGRLPWNDVPPWTKDYFSMVPTLKSAMYQNATILMAGDKPVSYVIPFFPESAHFVRLQTYVTQLPGENQKMRKDIEKRIVAPRKLYVMLTSPSDMAAMESFGVTTNRTACESMDTSMGDEITLCRASVKNASDTATALSNNANHGTSY